MSDHLTRDPTPTRRRVGRILLSFLLLAAAAALVALLSPDVARTDTCMAEPTSMSAGDDWPTGGADEPSCGGELPPPPPPPPPGDDGGGGGGGGGGSSCSGAVILYQHANYEGECWGFPAGETAYVGDAANDQASSIWVADGYVATIFQDGWFGGGYDNTVTAPDPWGWGSVGNDGVSSLVVQLSEPDASYYAGVSETEEPTAYDSTQLAASGCAKVGASVERRSPYRRQWRYALLTRFCWNGIEITAVWEREIAVTIDPIPFPLSLIQGWRHTPVSFQPGESDYPSTVLRADARFEYCGFKYGCITSYEPWVRIELRANGQALCSLNVRTQPFPCARVG